MPRFFPEQHLDSPILDYPLRYVTEHLTESKVVDLDRVEKSRGDIVGDIRMNNQEKYIRRVILDALVTSQNYQHLRNVPFTVHIPEMFPRFLVIQILIGRRSRSTINA